MDCVMEEAKNVEENINHNAVACDKCITDLEEETNKEDQLDYVEENRCLEDLGEEYCNELGTLYGYGCVFKKDRCMRGHRKLKFDFLGDYKKYLKKQKEQDACKRAGGKFKKNKCNKRKGGGGCCRLASPKKMKCQQIERRDVCRAVGCTWDEQKPRLCFGAITLAKRQK